MIRDRALHYAGLATLAVAIALSLDLLTYKLVGYDLAAYILGARRLVAGEALYQTGPVVLGPFGQFVYPPPVALLFVPLAALPFNVSRALMLLALLALSAALCWWLTRGLRPAVRYFVAAGIVQFFPLVWEVSLGNLTLVTLGLCLLGWHMRNAVPGGVALAAGLGLKLLPIPLVPFLLAAGRSRQVVHMTAALLAVAILTFPLVGHHWLGFAALFQLLPAAPPGEGSNVVPVLFSAPALRMVLPTLAIGVAVVCGVAARLGTAIEEHAFRVALAAVPLFAATLWYPYLVFALPLLVTPAPALPSRWSRPGSVAARVSAWACMQDQVLRDPGRDFLLPLVGLLLLIAVGLAELRFAVSSSRERVAQAVAASASA